MTRLTVADAAVTIEMRAGETVLAGLARSGYAYRVGCRRGGCGTCKVDLVDGQVTYNATVSSQVLTTDEQAGGVCLSCRAIPVTDTTIRLSGHQQLRVVAPFLAALAGGTCRKAGTN